MPAPGGCARDRVRRSSAASLLLPFGLLLCLSGDASAAVEGAAASEVLRDCPLIFASFLATRPDGFKRAKGERCNGCHKSPAWITFASAKIVHPESCQAVITDQGTKFTASDNLPEDTAVLRYDEIDGSKIGTADLMHERMKGYQAFVKQAKREGWKANLVMVDSDTVIIDKVDDLFRRRGFDYGLTARKNPSMPVQGGVQFVRSDAYERASEFVGTVLQGWEAKHSRARTDRGFGFTNDQRAYADAIGNVRAINISLNKKGGSVFKSHEGGYTVFVLSAETWNKTPSGPGSLLKRDRVRVLHYKGGRKDGMRVAYAALKKGGTSAVWALRSLK